MSDSEGDEDSLCYTDASEGYSRSPATSMTDVRGGGSEKEGCVKPPVENESPSAETMNRIILPRLLEDRIEQRNSAINDLLFWLRKNEPKPEEWACPPKVQGSTGISNGLRPDNIMMYLLGNYPNAAATRLLPPLREALERLLAGRHVYEDANIGRLDDIELQFTTEWLSGELFLSIAEGTKYLPFNVLDELWKWMAPAAIEHLDVTYVFESWSTAFEKLLRDEDPRRFWWLVETLIDSTEACTTLPEEIWKLENRISLFKDLGSFRHSETLNRVLSIAFSQLIPIATSDYMRKKLAGLLVASDAVANDHSEFLGGLPERLRLRPLGDYLMELAQEAEVSRQASPVVLDDLWPDPREENRRVEEVTEPRTSSSTSSSSSSSLDSSSIDSDASSACSVEDPALQKKDIYALLLIETIVAVRNVTHRPITDVIFKASNPHVLGENRAKLENIMLQAINGSILDKHMRATLIDIIKEIQYNFNSMNID